MKKFYVMGIILLLLTNKLKAQQETAIWYFGYGAGLDFKNERPIAITNGKANVSEGSAVMSDKNGNLLFYTDGAVIWNKNHEVMQNGIGLMGGTSSTQAALIVPQPGNANIYYVFTVSDVSTDGMRYSIVDMREDEGLGAVTTTKNVLLHTPVTEKLSGVMDEANNEAWIMCHEWGSNNFVAYKLTESGINLTPVISSIGNNHDCGNCNIGFMKFSPDAKKIAVALDWSGDFVEVFNFNSTTGVVSDPVKLTIENPYGLEFSSDNSKLYVSTENGANHLYQFDLSGGMENLAASQKIIKSKRGYAGALQLAPDGKIYWARAATTSYLSVIEDPNQSGMACNLKDTAVYLETGFSSLGLPNFLQSYLGTPYISTSSVCVGGSLEFIVNNLGEVDSLNWDFDDPNSGANNISRDHSPSHTFTNSGIFNVKMNWMKKNLNKSKIFPVYVKESPVITFSGKNTVCEGENLTLTVSGGTSYRWVNNNITDPTIVIKPAQDITVSVTAWNEDLCEATASFDIKVNKIPTPPNALNATICFGETAELRATIPSFNQQVNWYLDNDKKYLLKENSSSYNPIVGASGEFVFYCTSKENGCESEAVAATIKVNEQPHVTINDLNPACVNDYSFELTAGSPAGGEYTGEGVYASRFYPTYVEKGEHEIKYTYTTENGCTGYASKNILITECKEEPINVIENPDLTIIPRYASGSVLLQYNNSFSENLRTKGSEIIIYDALGKAIYKRSNLFSSEMGEVLNIPGTSSGIYILEIKTGEKIIKKKFIL